MAERKVEVEHAFSEESWCSSSSSSSCDDEVEKSVCLLDARSADWVRGELPPARALRRSTSHGAWLSDSPFVPSRASSQDQIYMKWMDARGRTGHCSRTTSAEACAYTKGQRQALADEVMKRSGEMCMWMQLKSLARRQQLRYPGAGRCPGAPAVSDGEDHEEAAAKRIDRRRALGREANRFDEAYGAMQETMSGRLCFRAPTRSNTAAIGEVARAMSCDDEQLPH